MSRGTGRSHPRYVEYGKMIAARLYTELAEAEMSPYRLAASLKVHRGAISHYLNANLIPTPAMLVLIARTLKIPVSRLLPRRIPARRTR